MKLDQSRLEDTLKDYPMFLGARHLVDLGIFNTIYSLTLAHASGEVPPFTLISRRRKLYPKKELIHWLIYPSIQRESK